MDVQRFFIHAFAAIAIAATSACGVIGIGGDRSEGGENASAPGNDRLNRRQLEPQERIERNRRDSIFNLFSNRDDPNVTIEVNKYIWNAALEVLDFLPIQTVDPFSGVIVTGYGRPPGGGASYRATVHVTDPALDARTLKLALERQGGGAVDADTTRAVENAILTRARQLRIRDGNL